MTPDLREDLRTYLDALASQVEQASAERGLSESHRSAPSEFVTGPGPAHRRRFVAAAAVGIIAMIAAVLAIASPSESPEDAELEVGRPTPTPTAPPQLPPNWERGNLSTFLVSWAEMAPFDGGLIAVGTDDVGRGVVSRSSDGVRWDEESPLDLTGGSPRAVVAGNGSVVAVGWSPEGPASWVSQDGHTWDRTPVDGAWELRGIAHGDLGFVVVGTSLTSSPRAVPKASNQGEQTFPAAWASPDGRSWRRLELPANGPGTASGVASSGPVTLVVGAVDGRLVTFRHTDRWQSNEPVDGAAQIGFRSITWSGDRFVIAGSEDGAPAIWETEDGREVVSQDLRAIHTAHPQAVVAVDVAAIGPTVAVTISSDPNIVPNPPSDLPLWIRSGTTWSSGDPFGVQVAARGDRFVLLGDEAWLSSPVQ